MEEDRHSRSGTTSAGSSSNDSLHNSPGKSPKAHKKKIQTSKSKEGDMSISGSSTTTTNNLKHSSSIEFNTIDEMATPTDTNNTHNHSNSAHSSPNSVSLLLSTSSGEMNVVKEGVMWKRAKGFFRASWSEKFFMLVGGSLYYYEKISHEVHKGVLHLQGCHLMENPPSKIKRKHVFVLQSRGTDYYFAANSKEEETEWREAIRSCLDKKPAPPPDKWLGEKRKRRGLNGLQNKFIETAAGWGPSKKIILEFVTDDTFIILESVKSFITKYDSEEKALLIEKQLVSTGVKAALLYKERKLTKEHLMVARDPLHRLCDKIIDGYEIPFAFNVRELLETIQEVQAVMDKVLVPVLTPKTVTKLHALFQYFSNEDMLCDFFAKKKWKECAEVGETLRKLWDAGDL